MTVKVGERMGTSRKVEKMDEKEKERDMGCSETQIGEKCEWKASRNLL